MSRPALLLACALASLGLAAPAHAAPPVEQPPSVTTDIDLLLIHASRDYDSAAKMAKAASSKLGIALDLRGLVPVPNQGRYHPGLNNPSGQVDGQPCDDCYFARGLQGPETSISVEWTNLYQGLSPDLYIVVVGTAPHGDAALQTLLTKVKASYPDAYIKKAAIQAQWYE